MTQPTRHPRGRPRESIIYLRMTDRDRAAKRQTWPVRVYRLGEEPGDDLSDSTTPEQRLEMVAVLTRRMWELAGGRAPSYRREEMPGRVIRRV